MRVTALIIMGLSLSALRAVCQDRQGLGVHKFSADQIVQQVAVAETKNKLEKNHYNFELDYEVVELGQGDTVKGRFHRVTDIIFHDNGVETERLISFPPSTLTALTVTSEDMQDLLGIQPFALTQEELPNYEVKY